MTYDKNARCPSIYSPSSNNIYNICSHYVTCVVQVVVVLLLRFIGYASPCPLYTGDPDRYIMCLRYLVQHIRLHCNDGPLVINTMGWNRALGLQLLVDTIRYVSDRILQLLQSAGTLTVVRRQC